MAGRMELKAPLATDWSEQLVELTLPGVAVGAGLTLSLDGAAIDWQYTGESDRDGARVMLWLSLDAGQTRTLEWQDAASSPTDLTPAPWDWRQALVAGDAGSAVAGLAIDFAAPEARPDGVAGPFAAVGGRSMSSRIVCDAPLEDAQATRLATGPIFTEVELAYRFADHRSYTLRLRAFRAVAQVAVSERFGLRMGAKLVWTWNPDGAFDSLVSHRGPDFEGEPQPVLDTLGKERPRDILCRLQMPGIGEYFVPNNRYYWALYDSRDEAAGMLGVLGLRGGDWQQPAANMPVVYEAGGSACWTAPLETGARHFLLLSAPLETDYTPDRRFLFHRLQADWNQCRLDQHLDLDGSTVFDASCWQADGFWVGADIAAAARARIADYPSVQAALDDPDRWDSLYHSLRALLATGADGGETPDWSPAYDAMSARFAKWVRQFQGWRVGEHDYAKNVIGFTRRLRGLLIDYELMRRLDVLTPEQVGYLNSCFAFAARRITDEGRWPHERSWLHPMHPESSRPIYGYNGEHAPDKLVWTNSLPNFQSDPLCALAHIAALFPDHPDADDWLQKSLDDIDRQLTHYQGKSGAWIESIIYVLYTLSYMLITFRALKSRRGIDYFQDPRVRRIVAWLVRYFGPYDERFGAHSWPPIGNSVMPNRGAECLLMYAAELPADDPLRAQCYGIYQCNAREGVHAMQEHLPALMLAGAPTLDAEYPLPGPFASECMDEVGVAMRHHHLQPDESYLFQKIGWAKDHYEGDETAFSWHAMGTPLAMDYGTYTGDVGTWAAHNVVEIPDADALQRGFLADHHFTDAFDYTRCEVPVNLKLLWGRVRSFAEVDGKDGVVDRQTTPYYYIGDENPVGPKTWRMRTLLWLKPDVLLLYDRVYGDVPHRCNFHAVASQAAAAPDEPQRLVFDGQYGLDLQVYIQHPASFELETGELTPALRNRPGMTGEPHRQALARVYNHTDGIYRSALVASAKADCAPQFASVGEHGIRISHADGSETIAFLHDQPQDILLADDGIAFRGRVGYVRRLADGTLQAAILDGDSITAFGRSYRGRGPWTHNLDTPNAFHTLSGPPRRCTID